MGRIIESGCPKILIKDPKSYISKYMNNFESSNYSRALRELKTIENKPTIPLEEIKVLSTK